MAALQTTVSGIQSTAAFLSGSQTFTGINTFSASGNLLTGLVRFQASPAICGTADQGLVRYDSLTQTLQLCNGAAWRTITTSP